MPDALETAFLVRLGRVYKFFKNKYYVAVDVCIDTETDEPRVSYLPLYDPKAVIPYNQPLRRWNEMMTRPDYNYSGPRFVLLEDESSLTEAETKLLAEIRKRRCLPAC